MADNVPITAGAGTNIATDDAGAGGHVQIVKLAIGTDGSAVVIPADSDGLKVNTEIPAPATPDETETNTAIPPVAARLMAYDHVAAIWKKPSAATQDNCGSGNTFLVGVGAYNGSFYDRVRGDTTNGLDVDVTRIAAGTNTIGAVNVKPATSGGLSTFHLASAGTTNATNIKASAGQLFGWYVYNSNAAARKVAFHNTAGTPTAGASLHSSLVIPPLSAANVELSNGIAFGTGIAITTVTGLADNDSAAVAANDLIINIFYV